MRATRTLSSEPDQKRHALPIAQAQGQIYGLYNLIPYDRLCVALQGFKIKNKSFQVGPGACRNTYQGLQSIFVIPFAVAQCDLWS